MYARPVSNIPFYSPPSSLTTSSIHSPHPTHTRTLSQAKIIITTQSPPLQLTRPPSQKKLTLTCQKPTPTSKQLHDPIRNQRSEYYDKIQNIPSLRSSNISNDEPNMFLTEPILSQIKKQFQNKLIHLQIQYSNTNKQQIYKIQELQRRINENNRIIACKNKQIEELKIKYHDHSIKNSIAQERLFKSFVSRITDIEIKLSSITDFYQELKDNQQSNIQQLTQNCLSFFGNKVHSLKSQILSFCQETSSTINNLQKKLQLREKYQKSSDNTQGSTNSINASTLQQKQPQNGVSFWDDCFFYPPQHFSQDFHFLVDLKESKGSSMAIWIDQSQFLRYADSNSYIFNSKGSRISLCREELVILVEQNIIAIV